MTALQDMAMNIAAEQAGRAPEGTDTPNAPTGRLQRWFNTLNLGGKITLFFSANLGLALIAGLFVVVGYVELGERAEIIRSTHDQALKAERTLVQLSQAQRHAEMLTIRPSDARARAAGAALNEAKACIRSDTGPRCASPATGTSRPSTMPTAASCTV